MSGIERGIITVVVLGSLLWGTALALVYLLRDQSAGLPTNPVAVQVGPASNAAPADPGARIFPATVAPATTAEPTLEQKRKYLVDFWGQAESGNRPHGRWEDRSGQLLAAPTVESASTPATQPAAEMNLASTPVSIHVANLPARAALAALAHAAGIKVAVLPRGAWQQSEFPSASLDADGKPMIEVLNELCCKVGLTGNANMGWNWDIPTLADPAERLMILQVQSPDEAMGPWIVSGPFGFEVTQVDHTAELNPGADAAGTVQITLSVEHEPRMVLAGQSCQLKATEAVDDKGNKLTGWSQAQSESWGDANGSISVLLTCPKDCGRTIARLSGIERFLVQTSARRIELPIGADASEMNKTVGELNLTIGPWQLNFPQQIHCAFTLQRGNMDDVQWARRARALGNLHPVLLDANGTPLPAGHPMNSSNYGRSATCDYMWIQQMYYGNETLLRPAKLRVDIPTDFEVVDVPVHFENLPLP
jgi:hypothetical protein